MMCDVRCDVKKRKLTEGREAVWIPTWKKMDLKDIKDLHFEMKMALQYNGWFIYSSSPPSSSIISGNNFFRPFCDTFRIITLCLLIKSWYLGHFSNNTSCCPTSTTLWLCITTIWSACRIVERRCATMITVRPFTALSIACWTRCSDSASSAD